MWASFIQQATLSTGWYRTIQYLIGFNSSRGANCSRFLLQMALVGFSICLSHSVHLTLNTSWQYEYTMPGQIWNRAEMKILRKRYLMNALSLDGFRMV